MRKTFRPYAPRQSLLLPASPLDWLPKDHLALFVLDVVEQLDLKPIMRHYERETRGMPPHHPKMMVGLLLYAYAVGVPSSRRIEKKTHEDVAFRVLAAGQSPDHTRIAEFRRIHSHSLALLFVQVLRLCQKAGLVKLGHVAVDGTKLAANASKHKAMSYKRMQQEEERLRQKVEDLLAGADAVDAEEDALYGKDRRGDELPEELKHAETRRAKIKEAMASLEEEARQAQAAEEKQKKSRKQKNHPSGLPQHRVPTTKDGKPTEKAQRNFVDPDSRIMKTNAGYVQGYNAQAAVDEQAQVVVACALTNQPPDVEHLVPVLDLVEKHLGGPPRKVTADSGYYSEENVASLLARGIDPYLATGRLKHGESPPAPRGRRPAGLSTKQRMARKLMTKRGRTVYAKRKWVAEPVFGMTKAVRGLRQLLRRGIEAARDEWSFICATHNLLKLYRAQKPA